MGGGAAPAAKEDATFRRQAEAALSRLIEQGVDVDGLMKKRRQLIRHRPQLALAPNPEVVGEQVRLPGYIVPLSFDGLNVTEFLLVPIAGACVLTPPLPANQMVHVLYPLA